MLAAALQSGGGKAADSRVLVAGDAVPCVPSVRPDAADRETSCWQRGKPWTPCGKSYLFQASSPGH